jgi:hypothetical protein
VRGERTRPDHSCRLSVTSPRRPLSGGPFVPSRDGRRRRSRSTCGRPRCPPAWCRGRGRLLQLVALAVVGGIATGGLARRVGGGVDALSILVLGPRAHRLTGRVRDAAARRTPGKAVMGLRVGRDGRRPPSLSARRSCAGWPAPSSSGPGITLFGRGVFHLPAQRPGQARRGTARRHRRPAGAGDGQGRDRRHHAAALAGWAAGSTCPGCPTTSRCPRGSSSRGRASSPTLPARSSGDGLGRCRDRGRRAAAAWHTGVGGSCRRCSPSAAAGSTSGWRADRLRRLRRRGGLPPGPAHHDPARARCTCGPGTGRLRRAVLTRSEPAGRPAPDRPGPHRGGGADGAPRGSAEADAGHAHLVRLRGRPAPGRRPVPIR